MDWKPFLADFNLVYHATTLELAEQQLEALDPKWGKKFPLALYSWRKNWDKLNRYFKYAPAIREMLYATNAIEGFHRQARKVTKIEGAFPSDMTMLKLVYLAYRNIRKK